ncbi:MAG: peptide chain release factor N(5)-glutamine methyltransferase [Thermoguttaceae bacterium]|nr:peptide chain release factor N(5)-glutamine methyltransferase [Thermoguttaceae bacterium]
MAQDGDWTVKSLLEWTTDFFARKGFESPRLDAEVLLAKAMGTSRVDLFVRYDEKPSDEVRATFREFARRRGAREPVALIVGRKEFYSLDFDVDSRVLIPRPETEQLVLEAIETIKKRNKELGGESPAQSLCDVGTGSGCVAIALAKNLPNATIVALDVDQGALDVAKKNAEKLGVADRIEFRLGDLLDPVPLDLPEERRFDMILSNPPYVSEAEYAALDPTVRDYEPKIALLGGSTGAEIALRLAEQAPERLKRGGSIRFELSPTTVREVADAMARDPRWTGVEIRRDFARLERFVVASRAN